LPLSNVNIHDKENKTALYYAIESDKIEQFLKPNILEGKILFTNI
jgi:hypothetical protein